MYKNDAIKVKCGIRVKLLNKLKDTIDISNLSKSKNMLVNKLIK